MAEIIRNLDWSPLYISMKTGIAATIFSVLSPQDRKSVVGSTL